MKRRRRNKGAARLGNLGAGTHCEWGFTYSNWGGTLVRIAAGLGLGRVSGFGSHRFRGLFNES